MNFIAKLSVVGIAAVTLGGCAVVASPTSGTLFTAVKGPVTSGTAVEASRSGQSCAINVLGIVAVGDASIDAAKSNGGIKNVASVDTDSMAVLGLFGRFCTVVKGN
jgi:hypothetical protein